MPVFFLSSRTIVEALVGEVLHHVDASPADDDTDPDVAIARVENVGAVFGEFIHQVLKCVAINAAGWPDSQMMFSPYQLNETPLARSSSSAASVLSPGR